MTRYTEEFKQQAVELALASEAPYSHTAIELDINPKTLYNWIKAAKSTDKHLSTTTNKKQLAMENKRLLKELKRKEQELAILKKAAAYFAKLQG